METIQKAYQRLHRLETDEIVEYAYHLEQQIEEWNNANNKLEQQLQQYKDKEDKLREYITNKTHFMTENGIQYMCNSDDLLQILNEGVDG